MFEAFEYRVGEKYQLENLINMDDLKRLLEDFYKIAPFPVAVLNLRGEVLLESHWEPICTRFHRVHPETAAKCTQSDIHVNAELVKGVERHILYRCGNGLYDAASPILIEGKHLGNFFIGQFLLEPPNEEFFHKQAKCYGFDEEAYLEALSKVAITSKSDLRNKLDYLCDFAEFLGNIGKKESQRNRAIDALFESEEKYRLLIENATDAIYIAQDGMLKFVNPKAEMMTGYSAAELCRTPFPDIIHPEDKDMVLKKHQKRLDGEEISGIHSFRILNKSGKSLSVELNTVLINWEGKPATLNFLRDITVQKRLETKLQQAQKMEAMGTLAGGIAHDFNNLLMGIQGRTSLMKMDKDLSHPDFEHLMDIEDNVESATNLTRQLLGFARGGKYVIKSTDLNELIRKENKMFGRTRKEITLCEKFEKDIWHVEVDRGQIQQVLLNLYINACQAMPAGGKLDVQTENVILDENDARPFSISPGKYVKLSITDTGVGMDKKTRERIFDPFFTTKEMGRGTGLGLASAYGIIKNHDGFINVYSEKGLGTTFSLYIPASEKGVLKEEKAKGDTLKGSETVLFIDDEDIVTQVSEKILARLGYDVLTAGSGEEAVKIYQENKERIHIVVLDMIMPEMSGSEVYDRMKALNPKIKVLLSSGYSINGHATEILNRGCNGFIQKPFKVKELSQKLRKILDGK